MGPCVAGGAYLPIMSDEAMIVDGTGSVFLAGSYLVKSAIGETIDNETLGGATTHSEISGVTDYKFANDEECLDHIRNIFDKLGGHDSPELFNHIWTYDFATVRQIASDATGMPASLGRTRSASR